MGPAPISWQPSQYWDGNAGSWSSFGLRVGNPEQTVRVIPSTAGISTWLAPPKGCPPNQAGTTEGASCSDSRGGLYDGSKSESWHALSNNNLGIDSNLGNNLSAPYGLDTMTLGFSDSIGGPKLENQIIAAVAPQVYYIGLFGLSHHATNLTNFTDPHPSALTTMKNQSLIPSLSWAYTAGASYHSKGVFGSLTFGGYDASRFTSNDLKFDLAPDITRDLVVGLQAITSISANQTTTSLLPSPILIFIDSTQPNLYLPIEACKVFESTFGLTWNATSRNYWLDEALHQTLLTTNANITFTIGNKINSPSTVNITLPYASFDLEAKPPAVPSPTRYFPLRRAVNETQFTLGRVFMQEAYVITDYERSTFSVSQAKFEDSMKQKIVTIHPPTNESSGIGPKVIIGISVGSTVFVIAIVLLGILLLRRRRQKPQQQPSKDHSMAQDFSDFPEDFKTMTTYSVREIDGKSIDIKVGELPDTARAELQDETSPSGSGNEILEMGEAIPVVIHELGTHRSSKATTILDAARSSSRISNGRIFKSTEISRKSHFSASSMDGRPTVSTMITALARRSTLQSSVASSPTEADVSPSSARMPPDLDRSLPPTPISETPSETPMVSPMTPRFKRSLSMRRRPQGVEPMPRPSTSALTSPIKIISKFSDLPLKQEPLPESSTAKERKPAIPPSRSDSDLSEMSEVSEEEQIAKTYWI